MSIGINGGERIPAFSPISAIQISMWQSSKALILAELTFRGTNVNWADLSGANLSGANLSGANLWEANFSNADLKGTNLSGVGLIRAQLQ